MSDNSAIEWTDASWNPVRARLLHKVGNKAKGSIGWHCEHVTPGCEVCYAERFNQRLGTGLPFKPGHRKDVELFLDDNMLMLPLRWKKPRRIFVGSMTDLFADFVSDEWIDKMFAVMALSPRHTYQVLTKRAKRMRDYCVKTSRNTINGHIWSMLGTSAGSKIKHGGNWQMNWPLPNCWLGVSTERQQEADERIPLLLQTPAAIRFISAEPLLGSINLTSINHRGVVSGHSALCNRGLGKLDWVIAGGESGHGARTMHADWALSLRDQCAAANVAFHFKQWGEFLPVGQHLPGFGKVHGATAVKPGRMKLHYGGTPQQAPKHAFAKHGVTFASTADGQLTFRVGKKAAGRLLDGIEHNGMPRAHA